MGNNPRIPNNGAVLKNELSYSRKEKISKYIVVFILAGLFIFFIVASDSFLTYANVISILKQASFYGIMALGMMMVIVTMGIDLSIAGVLCFSGMMYAFFCQTTSFGLPMGVSAILALLVALGLGVANGAMVAFVGAPSFIATLATGQVAKGLAMLACDGKSISKGFPEGFSTIGKGTLGNTGIPYLIIIWILLVFVIYLLMDKTRFGRHVYMVGGNKDAAVTSGINVKGTLMGVYMISALLGGVAGILMTSRTSSASPLAGNGYELDCVAATVIGGTSLTGGIGNVWGTLLGVLVIGTLTVGMNVLGVGTYVQEIVKGLIIAFAVILDVQTKKQKSD